MADLEAQLHRPGYNTLALMESERIWTHALNAAGLNTPAPVQTKTGAGYATVDVDSIGMHHVSVIECQEVELLQAVIDAGDDHQAASSFGRLGRLIASLHNQTSS